MMIEHRNVARLFSATEDWFGFNEQDVWSLFHSFAFDFSVWGDGAQPDAECVSPADCCPGRESAGAFAAPGDFRR
ncbi:hypothetical protein APX70_200098 [Pseudomonas syringae pv. maculicola]|uniref:Uncharacterized protein n=1 Tax=Pseudomonas syringae pv. maculicola TaxID=59511 RepID=A0A3M3AS71_PSEYM|nr:hypothetical protein APX70_200098 [Pseudomonas syringae pv. maculicola]